VFPAICLRVTGLVEPFILRVNTGRILPFQRAASLIVVMYPAPAAWPRHNLRM
jgi:subfamily B ATP-binding cassette protein HlyB/CyaB